MSISKLVLIVWMFLVGGVLVQWFKIDLRLIGWLAIAYAAVALIEALFGLSTIKTRLSRPAAE